MKIYRVGGSVRDKLMGLTPHDHDYVVVGATPSEMELLGYKQVGKDFPVFLHPETGEEYALARKERKIGSGHTDFETVFDTSVTIEEDLLRRDLTINAIAVPHNFEGEIVDPFGGRKDIENKVLRHVSAAFAEDPLRILRVARFKARFPDFEIHNDLYWLMYDMVDRGELDHISKDRIWAETKKAFLTKDPSQYFDLLCKLNAMKYISNTEYGYWFNEETLKKIILKTEKFNDEHKLLLRAAEFYTTFWYAMDDKMKPNKKLYLQTMRAAKLPLNVIELAAFAAEHADTFMHTIHWRNNIRTMVENLDKLNIKVMIQKIPTFLSDLFLILEVWDVESSEALARVFRIIEAYLDTKDFLACAVKRHMWEFGKEPTMDEYKDMLTVIKHANVEAATNRYFRGVHFNTETCSLYVDEDAIA
jgi:tRNA nucleotidyltransferase/poly(A) polymerase